MSRSSPDVISMSRCTGELLTDEARNKATWPALFGIEESRSRCAELLASAIHGLEMFGESADPLRFLASYIVERQR